MAAATIFTALFLALALPAADNGPTYRVTITNLTRGSAFAPILVVSHKPGLQFFVLGTAASAELEILAEEGNPSPLQSKIDADPATFDSAVIGAGLAPGATASATVRTRSQYDYISVAGMLVPTNDAFFSVNGMEGPKGNQAIVVVSPAYDAGTEANDEQCAAPTNGGPCGIGFAPGEGYVHVHAGIHGIGSLSAADHDWRNPVAMIVIERVP